MNENIVLFRTKYIFGCVCVSVRVVFFFSFRYFIDEYSVFFDVRTKFDM